MIRSGSQGPSDILCSTYLPHLQKARVDVHLEGLKTDTRNSKSECGHAGGLGKNEGWGERQKGAISHLA
jgi:hypothetical protein